VTLSSGIESNFYIDCKRTVLTAKGHALAGEVLHDALSKFAECEAVAGVAIGGCPLASAVSMVSLQRGNPLPALYVREVAKNHGSRNEIEGYSNVRPYMCVVILDDVVTTGRSILRSASVLRDNGLFISGAACLVDRLDGGREALRAEGIDLWAMSTIEDYAL